ncbi:MAG: hypothetical protein WBP45_04835 [Daejeonella sp.]
MDLDNNIDWIKKDAPTLATMSKKNPFNIPVNYFENLTNNINAKITVENFRFTDLEEFDIPEGYFEQLPAQIETQITLDKIKSISANHGFTLPEKYFENLEQRIISQTIANNNSIKPKQQRLISSWINYAAAACIILAVGISILWNNQNKSIDQQMAAIPDQEIIDYLQSETDIADTPAIIENLGNSTNAIELNENISAKELEQYINTTL